MKFQHHENYRQAAEKLSGLFSELSKKADAAGRAAQAVNAGHSDPSSVNQFLAATRQMQEMQMSFNLQYLQLQDNMQNENREHSVVVS
jgi:long-subunit fatty acid transport protein